MHIFPHDAKDKDGQPFWSGPKRAPAPVFYDPNDPLCAHFIVACANLIAFNLGIDQNRNTQAIAQEALQSDVPTFIPKNVKIEVPGEENKNQQADDSTAAPDDEPILAELLQQLKVEDIGITPKDISAAEFEKDDDSNYHIDFIHAAANLRARNYTIPECTQ